MRGAASGSAGRDQAALPITLLPLAALIPPGSQESAADPGEEAGQLHPLGSCQHPGGFVPQVPLPAVCTPCQRPHDGKPHQHLLGEFLPPMPRAALGLHSCSFDVVSVTNASSVGLSQSPQQGLQVRGGRAAPSWGTAGLRSGLGSPQSSCTPGAVLPGAGCSRAPSPWPKAASEAQADLLAWGCLPACLLLGSSLRRSGPPPALRNPPGALAHLTAVLLSSCLSGRAGSTTNCASGRPSWSSSARRTSSRTTSTSWITPGRSCSS